MIDKNSNHSKSRSRSDSRDSRTIDIDQLIEQFAAECRSGKNPSIAKYKEQFPQHETDIHELFPSIQWMEQLKDAEQGERSQLSNLSATKHPECIEDYQIVREIGRGGMGIVYEAFQKTLQRRVALKLLNDNAIPSPKRIARFAREARSAAGLHHSNIVPVFGFGQFEDTHYYAMQFIDGVTIEEVVRALRATLDDDKQRASPDDAVLEPDPTETSSSAISQANALRHGHYNRRRNLESESEIRTANSVDETASPTPSAADSMSATDLTKQDLTRVDAETDAVERFAPTQVQQPGTNDTFDLFQLTAEKSQISLADNLTDVDGVFVEASRDRHLELDKLGKPYWNSVARIGFQVADALNYAHNCKVVHRDIKPSNLLLDSKGVVWVADFGLAKAIEHDDLTRTGDTVGTLRYMSPEQVSGTVDHRSDIYSLGLSLFELATLEQAFDQQNQAQLFKNKTTGSISAPRKINPQIPRDLETIILKATATDPANRYQTAAKMATDLQLYLEDRPIQSRPANKIERLWRWSRRNPAIASLSGLAIGLLIAIAIISTVSNFRTTAALNEATEAKSKLQKKNSELELKKQEVDRSLEETEQAKLDALNNLKVAMAAFEQIRNNLSARGVPVSYELELSGSPTPQVTTLTPEDAELLDLLIGFYEEFARQNSDDLQIQTRKAEAQLHLGILYIRLLEHREAKRALRDSLTDYEALSRQDPDDLELIIARAQVLNHLCICYNDEADVVRSMSSYKESKTLLRDSLRNHPDSLELQFELAKTLDLFGELMIRSGIPELSRENSATDRAAAGRESSGSRGIAERSRSQMNPIELVRGDLTNAARILEQLVDTEPANFDYLIALAKTQRHQLVIALLTNRNESATRYFESAIKSLTLLADSFPYNPEYRFELADTLSLASTQLKTIENLAAAKKQIEKAISYCETLIENFPNESEYQLLEANCYRKLALAAAADEKFDDSIKAFEQANEKMIGLVELYPEMPTYRIHLTLNQKQMADTLIEFGRHQDQTRYIIRAKLILSESVGEFTEFARENESPFYPRVMASLLYSMSRAHLELGEFEIAARVEARSQGLSNRHNFGSRRYSDRYRFQRPGPPR